ncbi:MAG: pilus assembly PilX family protein [Planctomycetota bacterium]
MRPKRKPARLKHAGAVLIVSMIFVVIFSALAICMATVSGNNVQLANNHQDLNSALAAAQSGHEVMRYLLSNILIASSATPEQYLNEIVTTIQTTSPLANVNLDSSGAILSVPLDSVAGHTFEGQLQVDTSQSPPLLQLSVTGHSGQTSRTIAVTYSIERYEFPIFHYGLATRGPLYFTGSPGGCTITATNSAWEADVFVASEGDALAVQCLGNSSFDGDFSIGNEVGYFDFQRELQIAGDVGQAAIDNHVFVGEETLEFPAPDTTYFTHYATGPIVDSSWDFTKNHTLINATIKGGTSPTFTGSVTIQGILFIESPNKVTFDRTVLLEGMIVADGDIDNPDPGQNNLVFAGNFDSQPFPPDPQFDAMRAEEGTSVLAPGFKTTFCGNFSTLQGAVAVSGAVFAGNMNAQIRGTIINYSDSPTLIEGNATINFDRVGTTKIPAGFDLYRELLYEPASYSEI